MLQKDLRQEARSRIALNTLLVFAVASVMLVWFALGNGALTPAIQAAFLWIVLVFSSGIGMGRAFVQEAERETVLFLRLYVPPGAVYVGKLAFTLLLVWVVALVSTLVFLVVLGVQVAHPDLLALALLLGGMGLAGSTTLLSAIMARTSGGGAALLPVLLFPLLVPLLLSGVRLTRDALEGGRGWMAADDPLMTLVAYAVVVISASVLLFDYVWED